MFTIDKGLCVTTEQKLLWNIMELLETVALSNSQPKVEEVTTSNNSIIVDQPKKTGCTYCGGTHKNKGEFLACSRKFKKRSDLK